MTSTGARPAVGRRLRLPRERHGRPPRRRLRDLLVPVLAVLLLPGAWVAFPAAAHAAAGTIEAFAGTGSAGFSGDGGLATAATMNQPSALAVGPDGSVYVSDESNNRIRRIAPDGVISTYAGNGSKGSAGDGGVATSAQMEQVYGVAVDAAGHLYFSQVNHNIVRRVDAVTKIVTLFAGTRSNQGGFAGDGGQATSAELRDPRGLAVTGDGSLLIADTGNARVRKVAPDGIISTVAGNGSVGSSGDGGPATSAALSSPHGVSTDSAGSFWIADTGNDRVRRVDASGVIVAVAGGGTSSDGALATSAALSDPTGVTAAGGLVFIAEYSAHRIRMVRADGTIATLAGNGTGSTTGNGGDAGSATVNAPLDVALTADGDLLEAERFGQVVRSISAVVPPSAPTLAGTSPTSPGTATTVGVRGSAPAGTSVQVHADSGCSAVVASGTAEDLAGAGIPVTVAPDSTTTFWATSTSPGGAVSTCSTTSVTYTADSTAPAAPVLTGSPPSPSSSTTLSWSFTAEDEAVATCTVSRAGTVVVTRSPCTSPASFDLSGEVDGSYVFSLRVTDAAGNASPTTTSADHVLDRTPPAAPVFTSSPASPSSERLPSWAFTAESGSTTSCELRRNGVPVAGAEYAGCTSPKTYDLTGQPADTYTVAIKAGDLAGNPGPEAESDAYVLTEPGVGVPVITSSPGATGSGTSLSWGFSVDAGYVPTCVVTLDGTTVAGPSTPCTSPATHTATTDGLYRLTVSTSAGSATSDYRLDTQAPVAPTIDTGPPAAGSLADVEWSFSGEGPGFECALLRGDTVVSSYAACTSPARYALPAEGGHTFAVRAVDAAVNRSASATSSYRYDATAPDEPAPALTAGQSSPGRSTTVAWDFPLEPGATARCQLDREGTVVRPYADCASGDLHQLDAGNGLYTVSVTSADAAGNRSSAGTSTYRLDTAPPPAPVVTRLHPAGEVGTSTAPRWSFGTETLATTRCRLTRNGTVVRAEGPCSAEYAPDLIGEPVGVYVFSVVATDVAGNPGAASTSSYELVAVRTPAVTAGQLSPGATRTLRWTLDVAAGETAQCRLTGPADVTPPAWASCPAEHVLADDAPDGQYVFAARLLDPEGAAGAATTAEHELYTAVPAAPAFVSTPLASGIETTMRWEFTVPARSTPQCALASGTVLRGFSSCTSPLTTTADQGATEYRLSVRAVSVTGVAGSAVTSSYVLLGPVVSTPQELSPSPSPTTAPPSPSNSPTPTPLPTAAPSPPPLTAPPPFVGPVTPSPGPSPTPAPEPDAAPVAAPEPIPAPAPAPAPLAPDNEQVMRSADPVDTSAVPQPSSTPEPAAETPAPTSSSTGPTGPPVPAAETPAPTSSSTGPTGPPVPAVLLVGVTQRAGEVGKVFSRAGGAVLAALSPVRLSEGAQAVASFIADLEAEQVARAAAVAAPKSAFPLALVLLVGAFLAVQNRIDRNDPKLALAPVLAARHLEFPPTGQVRGI